MTRVRSSPWLDQRATLLVTLLRERHGLIVSEDAARQDISDHLDHVASIRCIGRQAAKMYVSEDVIGDMAARIAAFVDHHPGQSASSTWTGQDDRRWAEPGTGGWRNYRTQRAGRSNRHR